MNFSDIRSSLLKYKKEEFDNNFVKLSIDFFSKKNQINLITDNEYELFGLKIHLLYNLNSYKFYFSEKEPKEYLILRKIKLSEKQANNLINQLSGIAKNNIIICDKLRTDKRLFYFFVLEKNNENYSEDELKNDLYEYISLFLGLHVFYFLEHQNLENYCNENILNNSKDSLNELKQFTKTYKKLSWTEKDKFMIFSGMIFQFMGTLYTQDLDLYYIAGNDKNFKSYISSLYNYDTTFVLKDKILHPKKKAYSYEHNWIKYEIPSLVGIDNIYELFINPKHHFHFFGFKCIDIIINVQRVMKRNNAFSVIDLMLLKTLNNIDYLKDFCINNLGVRQGRMVVVNDESVDRLHNKVIKFMKKWYNKDIDKGYLKEHIKKCDNVYKTIYRGKKKEVNRVEEFNRKVIIDFIKKYVDKCKKILDIGVGTGKIIKGYKKIGKKVKIDAIEPSVYSINDFNKINNECEDVTLLWGFGDKSWEGEKINRVKYDVIVLSYSIHNMLDNLDVLLNNINNVSKKGTIIIISFIDGKKIYDNLNNDKLEIIHKDDVMWGVYKYNEEVPNNYKKFKMLFFMKDVFGLSNGSEEYLIDLEELKNKFSDYEILEETSHSRLSYENMIKYEYEKKILDYQYTLILRKK